MGDIEAVLLFYCLPLCTTVEDGARQCLSSTSCPSCARALSLSLSLSLSLLLPNINVNTVILGNESNTKNKQTNTQIKIGQPTGMFAADEHLGGRNPSRGTELCTIVEVMYSLGLLHQIEGTKT